MDKGIILLGHGSGGRLSHKLLEETILPALSPTGAAQGDDAALLTVPSGRLAFTTDGYVVDPLFFPGGNIGHLAINGTVNDLSVMGARPLYVSVGLVVEEGFALADFERVLEAMRQAAEAAGVAIVTGDTKVVPRGKADRLFITTSGIGVIEHEYPIGGSNARPGDAVIVSGTIGDHGIAIMASREGLALQTEITSDCAALNSLVEAIIGTGGAAVHVLRDPTRGGVATTVKEIALQSRVGVRLREADLPVKDAVRGVCEILGFDPLYVANEGKLLAFVAPDAAHEVVAAMRRHPLGADAAIIGEVTDTGDGKVEMETVVGGRRGVEMLAGEQLPRIC